MASSWTYSFSNKILLEFNDKSAMYVSSKTLVPMQETNKIATLDLYKC